jgi:hypothetical protein
VLVTASAGVFTDLLVQKGNHMQIAALLALHTPVAAATAGSWCALAVAARTPHQAGQLAPAATHPTPPVSGSTQVLSDFDTRVLHLVGDNKLGTRRGSGLAAKAAVDQLAVLTTERPSAMSMPSRQGVHEPAASSVLTDLLSLRRSS